MLSVKNYFRFVHIIIEMIIHYFLKKLIKIGENRYWSIVRYIVSFSFFKDFDSVRGQIFFGTNIRLLLSIIG